MISFSQHAVDAFGQLSEQASLDRLVDYISARFPAFAHKIGRDRVSGLVAKQRATMARFGIETEADLATTMDLTVMYGSNFWKADWADDVFLIEPLSGAERTQIFRERCQAALNPDRGGYAT